MTNYMYVAENIEEAWWLENAVSHNKTFRNEIQVNRIYLRL